MQVKRLRRRWTAAALAVAVAAAGATILAFREASREREALVNAFIAERLVLLRGEIRDLEVDLSDFREHLEIAAKVLATTTDPVLERIELDSVISVVRYFELMSIHKADGTERMVVLDRTAPPPAGALAFVNERAKIALEAVRSQRSVLSAPMGESLESQYRALAAPIREEGNPEAVVLLVNVLRQLDRLRQGAGGESATVHVMERDGSISSVGALGRSLAPPSPEVLEILRRAQTGDAGAHALRSSGWRGRGSLPEEVIAFAPLSTTLGGTWGVAVVAPASFVAAQERAIVMRTLAFGGAIVIVLLGLGMILVVTGRRAVEMRERLDAAEEIARHAELAEKVLENVPAGVIVLDDEGKIASANRSARVVIPAAALGCPIEDAFPAAARETLEELAGLIARSRASGSVEGGAVEPLPLGGAGTHFAVYAVPLVHPSPEPRQLVVFEDVTEVRALSVQLLRAEKLVTVGVLAAGFAHEVGTPLGVMRGRAEMLVSRLTADSHEAANARIIVEEIDRISRTIRDLLDFSRVGPASSSAGVALQEVAAQVTDLLAIEAGRRGVKLVVSVPSTLPELAADPDQLKQVLVNLAMNALDACARGGQIHLRARAEVAPPLAFIEIEDDGAGIPVENRHQVFDPFFTTKKRGKGSGLGLAVVARIVRSHGAEIELDERVTRGSRFVIRWPLAAVAAEGTG